MKLIHKVAELDAFITGLAKLRFYRANVFVREMVKKPLFTAWTSAVNTASLSLTFNQNLTLYINCKYAFDLAPGYSGLQEREKETIAHLKKVG